MKVASTTAELKEWRSGTIGTVGFVPTMGYLHEGHLALVRRAAAENEVVAVSIFVNPLQFGPREDLRRYPRDMERDLGLLSRERVDLVFAPSPDQMYPPGFDACVEVGGLTQVLEGAKRPGHFRGVTTVVAKLFNLVRPTHAYFGQKDAQQLAVVRKMVDDLAMNLVVVGVPIVREPDGLAMSSRNVYLSPAERQAALVLHRALHLAAQMRQDGEKSAERLRRAMTDLIAQEPLASIDYISVADAGTLRELYTIDRPALVSLAVCVGSTRLIDNVNLT